MESIKTEGRKLFEQRLQFADRFMIYNRKCRDQQRRVHAIADVHTHLSDFYSISPRIGFWSAQGGCGKSTATEISYFFVQNPMLERNSGAGLLREIHQKVNRNNEYLPTILFDEVQNVLNPNGGNGTVADMLSCYTKGAKRTIWDDGKSISLDPFCPVITNGLTSKYEIPANYLERNISIFLERPLPEEQKQKEMWLFTLLQQEVEKEGLDGDCELRDPWTNWAYEIDRETMKNDQVKIIEHLKTEIDDGRQLQLCLPLAQTAYYLGDDYFELLIDDIKWLLTNRDIKHTNAEQLLCDLHEIFSDQANVEENWFLPTGTALAELNQMGERPWPFYKGHGLTAEHLATLLREWKITPERNSKQLRGYNVAAFVEPWKRAVKLEAPQWMKQSFDTKKQLIFDNGTDRIYRIDKIPCETTAKPMSMTAHF
jgi:Protein of unknown function (DUF3631)